MWGIVLSLVGGIVGTLFLQKSDNRPAPAPVQPVGSFSLFTALVLSGLALVLVLLLKAVKGVLK